MTTLELQEIVSEQLGHSVTNFRTLSGRVGETSGDFFNQRECSYSGLATTVEWSLELRWTFNQFEGEWYFSSDPM